MARNMDDWRESNEGTIWEDLDRIKRNWQGKVKDLRASNGKDLPTLRPGKTKEIATVDAQQELLSLVEGCSQEQSTVQQEKAQRTISSLSSHPPLS